MTIKKDSNRTRSLPSISITDLLENENKEIRIYQDILGFFITKIQPLLDDHINDIKSSYADFRTRELVNWLLENNSELVNEFLNSRIKKSYRAHSKTPLIVKRLEKLMELGLLIKTEDKVESLRNKDPTDLYTITARGTLLALSLDIHNHNKRSNKYKKILEFLLKRSLIYLSPGYRDWHNHYYHFLKEILENCVAEHSDIVLSFIDLFQDYQNGHDINFSELRSRINPIFFKEMVIDKKFRSLFCKTLQDFRISSLLKIDPNESTAREFMASARYLLKFQFKLDVEDHIERTISEFLKYESRNIREFQWEKRNDKINISSKEIFEEDNIKNISEEIVLDFEIKNQWEMERNRNLPQNERTTILVKCLQCNLIYPISFGIEKEILNEIKCKSCKTTSVRLYDFENESNSEYHRRLLVRFPWMNEANQ